MSESTLRWWPLLALVSACHGTPTQDPPIASFAHVPVVAFDSVFVPVSTVPLRPLPGEPIGFAAAIAVTATRVYVADPLQSNVKEFDLATGAFRRTVGRPGDGPGEFRRPAGLASARDGGLLVLDVRRNTVSSWDSSDTFMRERRVLGAFSNLMSLAGTDRVLLTGWSGEPSPMQGGAMARNILHEVDTSGVIATSYQTVAIPTNHPWAETFSTAAAAYMDPVLVSGTMGSNVVYFHDRSTGREWSAQIGAPWYHRPDWPERPTEGKGVIDAMNGWSRKQEMLVRLFSLDHARFLAQFQGYDADGRRLYHYIVADTSGSSALSTDRTPIQILSLMGGVAWGIEPDAQNGETVLRKLSIRLSYGDSGN